MTTTTRMKELDALRGLLAVWVVIFHYVTFYAILYKTKPLFSMPWIDYRMQLFCILSGFVISLVLDKSKTPRDFAFARFSRLYPCYVAVLLINVALYYFLTPPKQHITLVQFLGNLTMAQEWLGVKNIDSVFWYFAPELTFYAVMFFIFLFGKMKYIEEIGLVGLGLVLCNAKFPNAAPAIIVASKMLCFWHYFFIGILFYNLKFKGNAWQRHAALALCFIVQNMISHDAAALLCLGAGIVVFYFIIYDRLTWLAQKPLLFLGTISYSLFLIHQNMGYLIIKQLDKMGVNPWLKFIIPLAAALMVATILTYAVERPAMNLLRAWYKGQGALGRK